MRVSVIIPTRNRPDELRAALASVACQTHNDLELLVVDDGSSPENAACNQRLIETIPRDVTYLSLSRDTPHGSGPSCARNAGIFAATGELIGFCDDDDFWCDSGHLSAVTAAFAGRSTLDLVFANQAAHRGGKQVRDVWLPQLMDDLANSQSWRETPGGAMMLLAREKCLIDHFPHLNTCIVRRDVARRIGGFWELVRYHEDLDFFVRLIDASRDVGVRKQTVSVHNVPDRSLSNNASTTLREDEKQLINVAVALHLIEQCKDAACQQYAKRMGKYAFQHLALHAREQHEHSRAAAYARLAFASGPSFRGALYAAGLSATALFR